VFRHCVMFTWADNVSDTTKAAISAGLDELAELDCVTAYQHGPDAGISDGNWDYIAVGDFASVEDYRTYATDAGHLLLITDLIKPNISGRAAVQYEF
jgi:hypothetical protein